MKDAQLVRLDTIQYVYDLSLELSELCRDAGEHDLSKLMLEAAREALRCARRSKLFSQHLVALELERT